MIFVAHDQPAEVVKPRKQSFYLPASLVPAERPAILGRLTLSVVPMRCDELHSTLFSEAFVKRVAVVGLVANQAPERLVDPGTVECGLDEGDLMRRSAGHVCGDRKTSAVCNGHDLAALAALGLAHAGPPFFAPLKEPSMKASLRSIPPRRRRSSAKAVRILSKTPARTQFWKYRWQVWYGGYRSGISFQGAPVRNTHRMPLRTCRGSCGGRPRPSGRRLGFGINGSTNSHCACVSSMHHLSATPNPYFQDF